MATTNVTDQTGPAAEQAVYVGPRPFRTGQKLYGRDREAAQLISLLISQRLILLHAPSGAGKTSLVQAKVIPALQKRRFEIPMYRSPDDPEPQPVIVRVNREPEASDPPDANRYVLGALLSLELHRPDARRRSVAELAGLSMDQYLEEEFPAASRDVSEKGPDGEMFRPLLLVLDQFEELLTLNPTDQPAKEEFMQQLGEALGNRGRWALFAIREDFLGALEPYLPDIPTRLTTTYHLDLLRAEVATTAIREPAQGAGVTFEPGVVEHLVDDLRQVRVQEPNGSFQIKGGPYVEPVHLQVVCQSLWQIKGDAHEIKMTHLEQLSRGKGTGVDEVLAAYYAGRVIKAAAEGQVGERVVRDWFGKQLIGAQQVRRPVLVSEALGFGLTTQCLQVLDKAFLIRRENRSGAQWYELAHDRLMGPILTDNQAWRQNHLNALQIQAELWHERRRPAELLLSGKDLRESEKWAADEVGPLTEIEEDFLQASQHAQAEAMAEQEREHQRRRYRRMRYAVVAGLALLVILATATFVSFHFAIKAQRAELRSSWKAYAGQIGQAQRNLQGGNLRLAKQQLDACRRDYRGWEHEYLSTLLSKDRRTFYGPEFGHKASVTGVAISPDGKWIVSSSVDTTLKIWNVTTRQVTRTLKGHFGWVTSVAISSDGKWIVSGGVDRTLRIWDAATGKQIRTFTGHKDAVTSVAINPDGQWIVSGSQDSTAKVWDTMTGQVIHTLKGHTGWITSVAVAVSPDGQWIVSGSVDKTLKVWNRATGRVTRTLRGHTAVVTGVAVGPGGQWIVSGSVDKTLKIWNRATGQDTRTLTGHADAVTSVAFSPDGKRITGSCRDGMLTEWKWEREAQTSKRILNIKAHTGVVTSVAYMPLGGWIVSGSADTMLKMWDGPPQPVCPPLKGHTGPIWDVAISPDPPGKWIISASEDETLKVWDTLAGAEIATLRGHAKNNGVLSVAFSPDGKQIVSGSQDKTLKVWDTTTYKVTKTLTGHSRPVNSVAFSPDGRWIVSGSVDQSLKVWDVTTGETIRTLKGHTASVTSVAISPDGQWIVSGSVDQSLKVWDATTDEATQTLTGHEGPIWDVAVSPDGQWIVSAGSDGTLKVWDAATAEETLTLEGHTAWVTSVAFSPDGMRIVSGSEDDTLRMWELKTGQDILILRGQYDTVWGVAFSRDGKRIGSGSEDWTIKVWNATM